MCRWAAYIGEPIFMDEIVSSPRQSLVQQSIHSRRGKTEVNADGFGLAWYGERPVPGLYRDVYPAWSDDNLKSVAKQVRSGLFLAHVRASTETATSRNNCHPFAVGPWSFMHNGQIGGFGKFRRHVDMMIPEHLYEHRRGATDSEAIFLMALAEGLDVDPKSALEIVVGNLEAMSRRLGSAPHVRMTAAIANGERLFAVRYASDDYPPSLYHEKRAAGRAVVSEPLDDADGDWDEIPPGSWVEITRHDVVISAFEPQR
ncbi:class II glutamine amidotransferase [Rhodobacteraceae bacterium NNCM2]|nr:class II glutamine amidotransferase [Coraliihabitans acroporae]